MRVAEEVSEQAILGLLIYGKRNHISIFTEAVKSTLLMNGPGVPALLSTRGREQGEGIISAMFLLKQLSTREPWYSNSQQRTVGSSTKVFTTME